MGNVKFEYNRLNLTTIDSMYFTTDYQCDGSKVFFLFNGYSNDVSLLIHHEHISLEIIEQTLKQICIDHKIYPLHYGLGLEIYPKLIHNG